MNIRDIRSRLANLLGHSDEFLREQVRELAIEIEEVIREENNNIENSGRASEVIESYRNQHEAIVRQFQQIPVDKAHLLDRLYKAQEVLVTIDTVMYYIKWALPRCGKNSALITALRSDEEYFKESSYRWCQIVASMSAEMKLRDSSLRTKIQDGN